MELVRPAWKTEHTVGQIAAVLIRFEFCEPDTGHDAAVGRDGWKILDLALLDSKAAFRIPNSKNGCAPAVEPFWSHRTILQIGVDPRHGPHHLSLLPSGPDEVRDRPLRGGRSKWLKSSKYKTLRQEFSPA